MGCGSCGTTSGQPNGCKNNGTCGTDGCNKLTVFDWLENMKGPNHETKNKYLEVRFKNDRKQFHKNVDNLSIHVGDVISVASSPGHDVGIVTLTGELVRVQMKKKGVKEKDETVTNIYRKANEKDIQVWQNVREREAKTLMEARRIVISLNLEMKLSDVEFQGDGAKATFYYTAEGRVDFRQLIKDLAITFKVRVEMRQIGYRQEAAKVGGLGSCGRELCCSTWLTDFRSVSTTSARYQQLSINPQKLAGQCGKLKCCLNFELDSYLDALDDFPKMDSVIKTEKGRARCMKIDVFRKQVWLSYEGEASWFQFSTKEVNDFIALNKQNKTVEPLENLIKEEEVKVYKDIALEDDLNRFDKKPKQNNQKKRNPKNRKRQNNKKETTDSNSTKNPTKRKKPSNANKPKNDEKNTAK